VVKLLIGGVMGLLSWLILPGMILLGYMAQIMRNVMAGSDRPLPEWSDFGTLLSDGAKLFVVMLAYFVPYLVLVILGGIFTSIEQVQLLGVLFSCVGYLYALALYVILPAAAGQYVSTNSIGAALQFQEVLALVQNNIGDFLVVFLLGIVASIIGGLGAIACGIGLIFTIPYAYYVMAHLWAQVYQKARGGGNLPAVQTTPL
jgi:hypothetical protein